MRAILRKWRFMSRNQQRKALWSKQAKTSGRPNLAPSMSTSTSSPRSTSTPTCRKSARNRTTTRCHLSTRGTIIEQKLTIALYRKISCRAIAATLSLRPTTQVASGTSPASPRPECQRTLSLTNTQPKVGRRSSSHLPRSSFTRVAARYRRRWQVCKRQKVKISHLKRASYENLSVLMLARKTLLYKH